MAWSLAQAAKLEKYDLSRGIMMNLLRDGPILNYLTFENITSFNSIAIRWTNLPSVAFRRINEGYTTSEGDVEQVYESVYGFGGDMEIDRVFDKVNASMVKDPRSLLIEMKTKSMALHFNDYFINGDHATEPDGFEGLKKRISNMPSRQSVRASAKVGDGTAVNWPTGAGGKGNEGVAAFVQRLPNSIGYAEYAYVKQNKMTYTLLKNKDGYFVTPSDTAFKAPAAGADWNKTFFQITTEQPGKDTWPITNPTYILMYKSQDKPVNASNALKFFDWVYQNGDAMADELDYVPLPAVVKDLVRKQWADNIKDASGKAIAYK